MLRRRRRRKRRVGPDAPVRLANLIALYKFSKASDLVYLLYKATMELTHKPQCRVGRYER
jgi:hypothetical protein